MPHSTQTRTRGFGGSSRPSNRFRNDIGLPPSPTKVNTLDDGNRFTVGFGAGADGPGLPYFTMNGIVIVWGFGPLSTDSKLSTSNARPI